MADIRNLMYHTAGKEEQNQPEFCKTLYIRYNLQDHKVSRQLKSHSGFSTYPPLWTSQLVAIYDEIKNTSVIPNAKSESCKLSWKTMYHVNRRNELFLKVLRFYSLSNM